MPSERNALTCGALTVGFIIGLIVMALFVIVTTHLSVSLR